MTLFRFLKALIPLVILIPIVGIEDSALAQDTQVLSDWTLHGTFFRDEELPYAFLENKRGGQMWVQVGDSLGHARIIRIERGKVVALDGQREYFFFADLIGGKGGGGLPTLSLPRISLPLLEVGSAEDHRTLDAFLQEEFVRLQSEPSYISESNRRQLIQDIIRLGDAESLVPTAMTFAGEKDGDLVPGMRLTADIQPMGLQKGDILLHINGVSMTSPERLKDVLDVIQKSKWITFAFSRNNEAQVRLLEVR